MRITRRSLLAAGAAMTAASAVGLGAHGWSWYDRPPAAGLSAISQEEHDFITAVAEAWMPPGGVPAISGAEAKLGDYMDAVVASMAAEQGRLFRLLFHALDEETILSHGARFHRLDLEERTRVLAAWTSSPWFLQRQAIGALMALLSFGYTEHPEVAPMLRPMFRCGFGISP